MTRLPDNQAPRTDNARPASNNTARAYASDWTGFVSWCEEQNFDARLADAEWLAAYLHWLRVEGYQLTTARRVYAGVVARLRTLHPDAWPKGRRPAPCADELRAWE